MAKKILFLLVVFFTNIIQGITGFAGTMLAMPPSVMLVGFDTAKPILNALGLLSGIYIVAANRKSVNKKEFLKKLAKRTKQTWSSLFPNSNPVALDLLGKMLMFNPKKRYTVEQCLAHPYFEGLHNPEEEPITNRPFDWSFDDVELTKENLQNMVYEESIFFHPEDE